MKQKLFSIYMADLLINLAWTQLARVDSTTLSQRASRTHSATYSSFYKNELNTVKAYSSSEIRVMVKYTAKPYFLGILLHVFITLFHNKKL